MSAVDHRVRLLDWITRHSTVDITEQSEQQIEAGARDIPLSAWTRFLFGARAHGVEVTDRAVDDAEDRDEQIGVRCYTPRDTDTASPVVLYAHGGGWVGGGPNLSDWWCSHLAEAARVIVVCVDYRLAPRHRFPAGLLDFQAALHWAHHNASALGGGPDKLAVMGDSAGANLAAALCLLNRDQHGPVISHQTLLYAPLDLTLPAWPSFTAGTRAPLLTAAQMHSYAGHYLGPSGNPCDPYASPLRAPSLAGLPRAMIQIGDADPLRDHSHRYADALITAGVPVSLIEYPRTPHGHAMMPRIIRASGPALADTVAELTAVFHAHPYPACTTQPHPNRKGHRDDA